MAYDDALADRIRDVLADEPEIVEKRMFGGLAFLLGDKMAVAASGQGGLMVRVDPATSQTIVSTTNARLVDMRGKPMRGWLRVDLADVRTEQQLSEWIGIGTTYARSLRSQ